MELLKSGGKTGIKKLAAAMLLTLGTGAIGAIFSMYAPEIYSQLNLPSFAPPAWVYAPVWIVLYLLMGLAFYRILMLGRETPGAKDARFAFLLMLALNLLWSILFFGFSLRTAAFVDILLLLAASILCVIRFYKIDRTAGLLMIPNVLWVAFAALLNLSIVLLNR